MRPNGPFSYGTLAPRRRSWPLKVNFHWLLARILDIQPKLKFVSVRSLSTLVLRIEPGLTTTIFEFLMSRADRGARKLRPIR